MLNSRGPERTEQACGVYPTSGGEAVVPSMIDGRQVDFRRPRCSNSASGCPALSRSPVRNSHSARSSHRLNVDTVLAAQIPTASSGPCQRQDTRETTRRPSTPWPFARREGNHRHLCFLVQVDQRCKVPRDSLVHDVEQMLGEFVRRHACRAARGRCAGGAEPILGSVTRISRLLDPVVLTRICKRWLGKDEIQHKRHPRKPHSDSCPLLGR